MTALTLDSALTIAAATAIALVASLAACRLLAMAEILPDNPNGRSSHSRVTSRAGGLGIFAGFAAGVVILAAFLEGSRYLGDALLLLLSSFGAFLIGVLDDAAGLRAPVKLAGQIVLAFIFMFAAGFDFALAPPVFGVAIAGPLGLAAAVFWIVGFMNAYNFMDGSNGLAAGTGVIGLAALTALAAVSGAAFPALAALVLAASLFGFLPQNFIRGRLFMGDGGSQSVSFVIAALGVLAARETDGKISILIVGLIFLPLIADVALTLAHRALRGVNVIEAHREHVYQILLRRGRSHEYVAVVYMTMTALCVALAAIALIGAPSAQWAAALAGFALWFVFGLKMLRSGYVAGFFAGEETGAEAAD